MMNLTPLRIGLFLKPFLGWQGGKEYARNLLMSLQAYEKMRQPGSIEIHLFAGRSIPDASLEEFRPLAHAIHRLSVDIRRCPQTFFGELKQQGIDFAFPVHNTGLGTIRTADCIFDFQHKYLPTLFSAIDKRERDLSFARIIKYADKVVVSSETSRADLNKFFPGHDQAVRVLPFTTFPKDEWIAEDPRRVLDLYNLPSRFFHLSNQFWVHKNHSVVFHALKKMLDRGLEANLVCTGSLIDYRNSSYMDELLSYLHQNGMHPRVRLMGLMPRLDQLQVMRCALAVLQPSLFEGWSTVLEDARTFGKQTLCSSLPVHREQNLPEARFFAPDNPEELAGLMTQVWQSDRPGFEAGHEAEAFAKARERALDFAQKFHAIAAEPAPLPPGASF